MAEVVSLIVAAPALVDLAKYCGKLAIELYTYSEGRQKARTSHATLKRYYRRFPQSMVLQDLASEGTIKATEDMSKSILDRLVTVTDGLIDQNDTSISAIKYIMWRFGKKDVLEVILQLGRVQQNIQLIVNMLGIEACELEIENIVRMMERRQQ
ncbi:uncharacterized protein FIESC28_11180 [Fusarium coffeatum]|uniref:Uncharacterized protein n=1 Tax=Fusarium coffeatum TaxID=231269 RepID=A0A366QQB5_9HYPO|nr:uncharacterized protein FIESC28_11180 [Fusarium coffeatum]RBR06165.1 hypothetical protein FIESC28_11180 [Fusarium coffeatum]